MTHKTKIVEYFMDKFYIPKSQSDTPNIGYTINKNILYNIYTNNNILSVKDPNLLRYLINKYMELYHNNQEKYLSIQMLLSIYYKDIFSSNILNNSNESDKCFLILYELFDAIDENIFSSSGNKSNFFNNSFIYSYEISEDIFNLIMKDPHNFNIINNAIYSYNIRFILKNKINNDNNYRKKGESSNKNSLSKIQQLLSLIKLI
jgi:hypothetical protein